LMEQFDLSEIQARAILDMRLQKLTGLERDKIKSEYEELMQLIAELKSILADEGKRMSIIKEETLEMKEKYGDERRTDIDYAGGDFNIEDIIPDEAVVITISHLGYIKRTPLTEYKRQKRGGVGQRGVTTRDEDFLEYLFSATNHNYLLFFTEQGRCFWLRVFEVPEGSKTSKGRAIQNLINIPQDDKIRAFVNVPNLKDDEFVDSHYIIMATEQGVVKKTPLRSYARPRQNGINAITVREGDMLLEAKLTTGTSEVLIAATNGKAIRFNEEAVRPMGRTASGVRGILLAEPNDKVVGMVCVSDEEDATILVVSENGFGKRSSLEDYRLTNRGGKGVKTISITEKTGKLVSLKSVSDNDDLMIINKSGIAIRMQVEDLRVMGRATQGVKVISLKDGDSIAAVAKVMKDDDDLEDVNEIEFTGDTV